MCSSSRYLLVGGVLGVLVSTLTGSTGAGWLAAAVGVVALLVAERRYPGRFGGGSCALPASTDAAAGGRAATTPPADAPAGAEVGEPAGAPVVPAGEPPAPPQPSR
ncbi:MAG: hypothetical protein JXA83_02055 [Acidimicrobiales bacterium]|nr:hypothetical protein [Acidimicrobiales bacterium]